MATPAVFCKSMTVGESVSEDMAWSLAWGVGGLLLLVWALRTLNWAWWTPRRLERALRAQGLNGTPYRLPSGDLKENVRLAKEARSTPMPLTHNIVPRVLPFLRRAIDEYGKICFIWFGPVPRVTIMDPELVREVLSNKFGHFGKPKENPVGRLLFRGLVSYEGEKWVKHRRIMNPAFHVEKLKRMLPAFCACCSDLMSRWENLVGSEACYELDVWPEFQSFTGDVISRTAFGSSYEEGRRIFQLQAELAELLIQSIQYLYIPGYKFLPTPKNKRIKAVNREVRGLLRGIIKKREQAIKLGKASNDDLLGILMESNLEHYQEHGNKNAGMTTEDVIEECKLFYFAGQETTSVLLTWTMIILSMHPDWQIRARQEVLQVFGERKPDFDGLSRLKNVTMILYEVLRLYPPAVFLLRQTYKTMKLGDVIYPPGVTLLMPVIFIHHDPNYWGKDANEFNPERFAEGVSKASKDQVAFFPFGGGPRICIELCIAGSQDGTKLYPPAVFLLRQTYKTMKLGDVIYPPGVTLLMPVIFIHHDPNYWGKDANEFNPERFAEGVSKASKDQAFIEQNQPEARQILIDNPLLTRALFQAQIMLGMVQSPKVMSNTQQAWRQPQPAQVGQLQIVHSLQTVPAKVGEQSEPGSSQSLLSARQHHPTQPSISLPLASGSSQSLLSARQHHPTQPSISVPLASVPPLTFQSKAMPFPLSEPQTKGFLNLQVPSVTPIQSSQIQNISQPNPAAPHYSNLPSHMPMISVHPQQTLQNPGLFNQLLQPLLPPQPRQVAMQPFAFQFHPQTPHSLGLQPSSAPQQLLSQPLFHSGITPPSSFPQGQAPLPSQLPQHLYQEMATPAVFCKSMAVGESVSEDMAWSLAWGVGGLLLLVWALRTLNWAWWTPRRLERALRAQGLNGTPYRLPSGDLKENVRLAKEALSTPMPLTHNIVPRVLPFLRRAIDEYGKICFIWFGPVPRVTIMDPELVREVLSNKFGHFGKPKENPLGRLLFSGLVSYEGEKWVKHRRIMNPAFHVEKLKRMLPAFCACCSDLMSRWENLVGSEACYELDVWPEFQSFTGDVISRTAFGSSYEEGRRIFQLQAELAELLIQSIQYLYIPGYKFLPTPKNKRIKAVNREVRGLLRGIIMKREQAIKLGKASNDDLLGLLMESNLEHYQEHGNKNAGMTTEDVIEECKLFYFAGQETTSVLLTWTMIILSMHPDWQIRARQEVLQVFGERKPDFDGLSRLKNAIPTSGFPPEADIQDNETWRCDLPTSSIAVGESVSEGMAWSLAWGVGGLLLLVWALRTLNWAWWTPRRLERALRAQGLNGTPYRFPNGDLKENVRLAKEALSCLSPTTLSLASSLFSVAPSTSTRMLPAFCACCSDLMSRWENLVGSEACYELDVWPEFQSFTGDVISRTAFGSSYEEGRRIFQLQAEQAELLIQSIQNLYIPGYMFLPTPKNKRIKAVNREVRVLLRGIIKKREQAIKLGKASNDDLLGILMESNLEHYQEHGNKNAGMTTEDVIEECKLFYFAGQETTAVLLTWTMIVLSMHPGWQIRARQEVLQVFGERKPDFDGLSRLKNVTMILYEVLRLYPPGVFLQRQTYKTMKLGDVIYPPGVTLLMPVIFIHHDPNYWGKDANEFNPERFAEGVSKASKDQVSFFPFVFGRSIELKLEERRRMTAQQPQQQQQQVANSFTSQFAVMSKAQLYDILSQMKALIEQNQQDARQILIDNPLLTRALFQAQIMLGMVQSPKVMFNTQQAWRQPQPAQVEQPQIVHSLQTVPAKVGEQSEPGSSQSLLSARQQHPTQPSISLPLASGSSQSLLSARQQHPTQPSISVPLASVPPLTFQSKAMPLPLSEPQTKGFLNLQVPSVTPIQSSQIQNISQPNPAAPHYSNLPSHMPMISVHPQQTLQNPGLFNQLLQPPLPLQPRQVAMQTFAFQFHPQMPHSLGLQPSSAPQQLLSQSLFHSGITPPSSFPQGQAPLPSQAPQHLYQVGSSHIGTYYGTQISTSMQKDRGAPWVLGSSEITTVGTQLPGLPPIISGQMATGTSGQPPRAPPLTPEMEKALLQQVMGLTPEQINLLPPEQRNQAKGNVREQVNEVVIPNVELVEEFKTRDVLEDDVV
ncbi:hypothetical protein C4D60_Mb07t02130 [Musa balbisiana]|uniref:Uncharacterized protein n=1 Tax=Musa balbisiana TaxID=52838 RepID=A0A4V4H6C5_MUSBA|nr:hypothetical protein C4D60_Mb07t02130 [Musa balbisiana]